MLRLQGLQVRDKHAPKPHMHLAPAPTFVRRSPEAFVYQPRSPSKSPLPTRSSKSPERPATALLPTRCNKQSLAVPAIASACPDRRQLFDQISRTLLPREKELLPRQVALMAEFFVVHRTALASTLLATLPLLVQTAAPTEFKLVVHTIAAAAALPAPSCPPPPASVVADAALHLQIALHLQPHIPLATTQTNLEPALRLLFLLRSMHPRHVAMRSS